MGSWADVDTRLGSREALYAALLRAALRWGSARGRTPESEKGLGWKIQAAPDVETSRLSAGEGKHKKNETRKTDDEKNDREEKELTLQTFCEKLYDERLSEVTCR